MEQSQHYKYVSLETAATCVNQKVNFYGVIVEFEQPKPTKGSDMICTMTIKDMSYHSSGLRLIVFALDRDKLPHVRSIGDIIRIHRAKIEGHNNGVNAVVKKNISSFLLFEGRDRVDYRPYQSSSAEFKVMDHDEKIIKQLRSWLAHSPIGTDVNEYLLPVKGITEGVYFDLCCKILFVHEVSEIATVIYVWDGTDAPPRELEMKEEEEIANHDDLIDKSFIDSVPRDILCNFPCVGTVLRIFVDMNINELQQRLLGIGVWAKFRNITCRVQSGMWQGVMIPTSKIYPLSSDTVKTLERSTTSRLELESGCLPQWCPSPLNSITVTDYEGIKISTLMEVITHSQVTYKFRCLVRVIASLPWNVDQFFSQRENYEKKLEYVYRVRLTLEDSTARIHAYLYAEDGDKFFNGFPARKVKFSSETLARLKTKFHKLVGFTESINNEDGKPYRIRNPPWVKCCIKSYYLNKNSPWESRRYRIFGTTLLG